MMCLHITAHARTAEQEIIMSPEDQKDELGRLRNRHVAKLLSFIGNATPIIEAAIKTQFSMFADDVAVNILGVTPYSRERNEQR